MGREDLCGTDVAAGAEATYCEIYTCKLDGSPITISVDSSRSKEQAAPENRPAARINPGEQFRGSCLPAPESFGAASTTEPPATVAAPLRFWAQNPSIGYVTCPLGNF
jgi:hypothetical protein